MAGKFNYSRKTNRIITYNAPRVAQYGYLRATAQPTEKQKQFYNVLYARCKSNDPPACRHNGDRYSYTLAISTMIKTLTDAGLWYPARTAEA